MYDPLVVDTFIAVHADIAPAPATEISEQPLRAITNAAVTTLPSSVPGGLEDISGSTEEMLTLFSLARGLAPLSSLQDAADVISKHLRRLIPSALTVFYLYDRDNDELVSVHASGDNAALVAGHRIGTGQRLSGWVAANKQTIRNSDPVLDFGESARAMHPRLRSCLGTPLLVGNTLVGVLTVYSTSRNAFTEEHERVAEIVARQVAPVIQQAAESQRFATGRAREKHTGLPSLEDFRDLAAAQIAEATSHRPVTLLVIEVHSLERGSGMAGRHGIERALTDVARSARNSLRTADLLFQHTDDQLVALLIQTEEATGRAIATRLREAVNTDRKRLGGSEEWAVDVTVVSAPTHGRSIESLLGAAAAHGHWPTDGPQGDGGSNQSVH
jgi:GAF domain-containing protein